MESQKQQYSDTLNAHNKTGSEAEYVPKSALQKARDKVWRDNKRCNFPTTCIETSGVARSASQGTWGETSSKSQADSPLSRAMDRNSEPSGSPEVGFTDLCGDDDADDGDGIDSQTADAGGIDFSDSEAEKGFSQNSQPGSAGDKDGGGGGSSSSAVDKVPSNGKGKGKAPATTPPRSRGRHGHPKKQLETFRAHNLNGIGGNVTKAVEAMASVGGQLEKTMSVIAGMSGGAGAAGGGAGAGVAKKLSREEKIKLCLAVDSQYGTKVNQDNAQKLLDELLSS